MQRWTRRKFLGVLGASVVAPLGVKAAFCKPEKPSIPRNKSKPVAILTTDKELQLFTPADPIRYDVDNRPLRNLNENDRRLRDGVNNALTRLDFVEEQLGLVEVCLERKIKG